MPTQTQDYNDTTGPAPAGGAKTVGPGLVETGDASYQVVLTVAAYAEAEADRASRDLIYYRMTVDGISLDFAGYPTPSVDDEDAGGERLFTVSIKASGPMAVS